MPGSAVVLGIWKTLREANGGGTPSTKIARNIPVDPRESTRALCYGFHMSARSLRRATRGTGSLCAFALVWLATMVFPAPAKAFEDQATVSVDLGYSQIAAAESAIGSAGPTLGLSASVGLSDAFTISGRVGYALHPAEVTAHLLTFHAEVVYLIDILQIVPFVGLGINGAFAFANEAGANLGLHALVGVDYLVSRKVIVGLDVRVAWLPLELSAPSAGAILIQAGLRVSFAFEI